MHKISLSHCPICGENNFNLAKVLCKELISDWELDSNQVEYINNQQGFHCKSCGSNLRSMTLAASIMKHFKYKGLLKDFVETEGIWQNIKMLEVNEAGMLTPYLSNLHGHIIAKFPEIDIMNLPYTNESIDSITHSDTLEHIDNSLKALQECHRVLKKDGVMFYTIPIIHERLTKKRHNLNKSYHGVYTEKPDDYIVYTEYGADFYAEIFKAGFRDISVQTISDLSSLALVCKKD